MNPLSAWKALTMTGRLAACLVAIIVLLLIWWTITEPGRARHRAAEARANAIVSEGQAKATQDAVGVIIDHQKRDAETDRQAKEAEDEIRHAPEDQRNAVALARLCMSVSTRDQPPCVELRKSRPR